MDSPRQKYRPFETVRLPDRRWPDARIEQAPRWCSVDLRDGNQALAIPMNVPEKHELFQTLCRIGFKEIEIGFPSASDTEFAFTRELIEKGLIPEDVSVQVLVQAREHLIRRTIDSLKGAHRAIVHLYTPTNPAQREIVFNLSKAQVLEMAVNGTKLIRELTDALPDTHWQLEFSPETFVLTEPDYALEVCEAVAKAWGASAKRKIILNLPLTVEAGTPNTHADQIEWFCRHLSDREMAIVSLHTHNDRGTGVAATELGLMAGADRVEGTLFGNGERTGNLDIVTVALNMFSHGIDPKLDFRNLGAIREVYERVTRMSVHDRHPYGGDLVFTAFSGSHQDAINKGFKALQASNSKVWEVPYLPIDPAKSLGYFRTLHEVTSAVLSTLDSKEVVQLIVDKVISIMQVKASALRLRNETTHELELIATSGLSETFLAKGQPHTDQSICETLAGRPVLITDTANDPRLEYPVETVAEGIASILSMPIIAQQRVVGVLRLYSAEKRLYSQEEITFLSALAEISGIAIMNAKIYEKTNNDLSFWTATLGYMQD